MRLASVRRWARSTVEIESSWTQPSRWTAASTSVARPRRKRVVNPWWDTRYRRSCARLTVSIVALNELIPTLLPPPARILEVGCGAGELARALDAAGYDVLAIDPEAPEGPIFRRVSLEQLDDDGLFDLAVADRVLHHIHPLGPALD